MRSISSADLRGKLLSMSQLVEHDYSIYFDNGWYIIYDKERMVRLLNL